MVERHHANPPVFTQTFKKICRAESSPNLFSRLDHMKEQRKKIQAFMLLSLGVSIIFGNDEDT